MTDACESQRFTGRTPRSSGFLHRSGTGGCVVATRVRVGMPLVLSRGKETRRGAIRSDAKGDLIAAARATTAILASVGHAVDARVDTATFEVNADPRATGRIRAAGRHGRFRGRTTRRGACRVGVRARAQRLQIKDEIRFLGHDEDIGGWSRCAAARAHSSRTTPTPGRVNAGTTRRVRPWTACRRGAPGPQSDGRLALAPPGHPAR